MRIFTVILIILSSIIDLTAQCSCTDCPVPIISNQTTMSDLTISGSTNDQMGSNGQGLCQICVNFVHNAPNEIDFFLTSPSGSAVQLIEDSGLNVNQNVFFNICFVACSVPAMPDPGFSAIFDSSEPWQPNTTYSGTYYPSFGCLEDLIGDVNGNWNFTMTDNIGQDDGTLTNWELFFADNAGTGCQSSSCAPPPTCDANAGTLASNPQPACPGEFVTYSVSGQQTDPAYTNILIITDAAGVITEINPSTSGTVTSATCETITLYSYNFDASTGAIIPTIGSNINQIDCSASVPCCDLVNIPISFQDNTPPTFTNPPQNLNLTCIDQLPPAMPLAWTDNCNTSGSSIAVESGNGNPCTGGIITRTWDAVDPCGNPTSYTQIINITAAPIPLFLNLPDDITVDCDQVPAFPGQLIYDNFETGACALTGVIDGQITGSANECGGLIQFVWSDFDNCGRPLNHIQNIIVSAAPQANFIDLPQDITVSCDNIPSPAMDLFYTNSQVGCGEISGFAIPIISDNTTGCSGTISNYWEFEDNCGRLINHLQTITILPPALATFMDAPMDITVTCENYNNNPPDLVYDNGQTGICEIVGAVAPIVAGNVDPCGSSVTNTWIFIDACGRQITHFQNITIEPASEPTFVAPPADLVVSCDQLPLTVPNLDYSNSANGNCLISGNVSGVSIGTADFCGGMIEHLWVYTDDCGRTITYTQFIEVTPSSPPVFSNPPQDLTITCNDQFPIPGALMYSNGETGTCEQSGSVPAQINIIDALNQEFTWTYLNPCTNSPLVHIQTVTQFLGPDISVSPTAQTLCAGDNFDLSTLTVTDANGTNPTITFHSATPAMPGNELANTTVSPIVNTTYYIFADDGVGCTSEIPFEITIDLAPNAGTNGADDICFEAPDNIDLFSLLNGSPDPGGTWSDINAPGVDLSNPSNVSLSGLAPGMYTFLYSIGGTGGCPLSTAEVTLTLLDPITIVIESSNCSADLLTYEVIIQSNGFTIAVDFGNLSSLPGNEYLVEQIPIANNLTITASNPALANCNIIQVVNAPDCSCPSIDPPANDGDQEICFGENNPALTVTIGTDQIANWFDSAAGGNLILANSTSYTPTVTAPGNYQYYVESESTVDGCTSLNRTDIQLTIYENPEISVTTEDETCLGLENGQVIVQSILGTTFSIDGTNFSTNNEFNGLTPGSYIAYVLTDNDCANQIDFEIEMGLDLEFLNFTSTCNDNGTALNPSDDFFEVNFSVENNLGQVGPIDLSEIVAGNLGTYQFGENINLTFPADNQSLTLVATSLDGGCTQDISLGPLVPCSTDCELQIDLLDQICNDNNTPLDPTDDFHEITLNVISINAGASTTYEVSTVSGSQGIFMFGENVTLSFPADNSSPILNINDVADNQCQISAQLQTLASCSNACELIVATFSQNCLDNGTPLAPSDDFHEIEINISGTNVAPSTSYEIFSNAVSLGIFDYGQNITLTLPADGMTPLLNIFDLLDAQCQVDAQLNQLTSCSNVCQLTADVLTQNCFDNGTALNQNDDYFEIGLNISGTNVAPSISFEIFSGAVSLGVFNYSEDITLTFPADGNAPLINLIDLLDPQCALSIQLIQMTACSGICNIDPVVSNITCDNNNTGNDSSDDLFYFDLIVNSSNTSSSWQETNLALAGAFNQTVTYGPYNISAGNFQLNFQDINDFGCAASIDIIAPMSCSVCSGTVEAGDNVLINCYNPTDTLIGLASLPGSYTWSNALGSILSSTDTLIVTQAGTYIFEADFGDGCIAFDGAIVTEDFSSPNANAGSDQTLDCLNGEAILNGSLSSQGVNLVFVWTDDQFNFVSNLISPTVDMPGTYLLSILNTTNGCSSNLDEVIVDENLEAPISNAGPDQNISCFQAMVTLSGSATPINPNYIYTWIDESNVIVSNDQNYQTAIPGIYSLSVENPQNGCISSIDEVLVNDQTQMPTAVINAAPDVLLNCVIDVLTLSSLPQDNVVYSWEVPGEIFFTPTVTITSPGVVILNALDTITGCSNTNQINIDDFTDYPIIDIVPPNPITCIDEEITLNASNSQFGNDITYQWYDGFGNIIPGGNGNLLIVYQGGFYIFESFDASNNCINSDTVFVESFLDVPQSNATEDLSLPCLETSTQLNIDLITPLSDVDILWSSVEGTIVNGQNGTSPAIAGLGTYFVTIENNISGCVVIDSIVVSNNPDVPSALLATVNDENCLDAANGIINIEGIDGGAAPYEYLLSNGEQNSNGNFSNLTPGIYNLEIADFNGCSFDTTFTIEPGIELEIDVPDMITVFQNQPGILQAVLNIPDDEIGSIQWTPEQNLSCPDCLTTSVVIGEDQDFLITVVHENGCLVTATIRLLVRPDVGIYIPNAFSPNEDGTNDVFTLFANDRVVNVESMLIFDRWGALIFENRDFDHSQLEFGWDGTHRGRPLNPAVFVYTFVVNLDDGTTQRISGDITLVK